MRKFRFVLTLLLLIFNYYLSSQNYINGTVVDENNNQRLAFVNIVVNDNGTLGTTSDIDGNFSLEIDEQISNLTFSFVGYEKKKVDINEGETDIIVKLKPQYIELSEIVIDGRRNPAHRIIDSVFKHRDSNNPKSQSSYYYKIYDNMIFTIDTTSNIFDDTLRNIFKDNDMMVMETVSEQYYQKPNKNKKIVLANKISGMNNSKGIYLLENLQSIGFSEDLVTVNNINFVNPISKDSYKKYIFVLEDAFTTEENDSIFTISFAPYKNTSFNSLKGTITINSDNWAIQNIKASPTKQDIFDIDIQQMYEKIDGYWFPKQLNTNIKILLLEDFEDSSNNSYILGIGRSYISEIEINKEIDKEIFDMYDFYVNENAGKSYDIIQNYRYEKIDNERLEATYKFVDETLDKFHIDFDRVYEALSFLSGNEVPIGFVNIKFKDIIDYNIGNGFMLGLGLKTNNKLSKYFSIGGFGNYWFKAKEFNYGGNIDFNLLGSKDMKLSFSAAHAFERLGEYGFDNNSTILNITNAKLYYINASSLNNSVSAQYSTYFNKNIKGFVVFEVADKLVNNNLSQNTYRLSTLDFKLRIAFKETFINSGNGIRAKGKANPVIWLSYQKNLKDVFGSPYNFDKVEFKFKGSNETRFWGTSSLIAQVGYINGLSPITELFNIYGNNYRKWGSFSNECFNTMMPDEFFCDRFAALYLTHKFKGLFPNFKYFNPGFTVITNIAWGDLNNGNNYNIKDLSKGYYESGLIIDKLNDGLDIGIGIFYRYGPYSFDNIKDNFVYKFSTSFSF